MTEFESFLRIVTAQAYQNPTQHVTANRLETWIRQAISQKVHHDAAIEAQMNEFLGHPSTSSSEKDNGSK